MARTPLFGRLRRVLRGKGCAGYELRAAPEPTGRRQFLAQAGGTWFALGFGGSFGLPACQAPQPKSTADAAGPQRTAIAIIGAGLAGLHCAYRLRAAGVRADVYEANSRAGGRMYTERTHFAPQVAELGGEFIDTGHTTLHTLSTELSVPLDDRAALLRSIAKPELWWLGGKSVSEHTLVEQFRQVAPQITSAVARIEAQDETTLFEQLNRQSLATWLDENVPAQRFPELRAVLSSAYRGEYGRELHDQSALNLLYLIGHDPPEPFRVFGDSDERFHAHAGNQTFTDELAKRLPEQIHFGHRLAAIRGGAGKGFELVFERRGSSELRLTAEKVVLTLPFTLLRLIDTRELELPELKRRAIAELGYGTNSKLIGRFQSRPWRTPHGATGSVTSDAPFQQVWDSSVGQPGSSGILTNFLGGDAGERAGEGGEVARFSETLAELEPLWPGLGAQFTGHAQRMHWPSHPHTMGSYACYQPGQWEFWGHEGQRVGDLHFAGEHTSLDFQGYMEGAAESGARAAGEILTDLGIAPTALHQALLELQSDLPLRSHGGVPLVIARRNARLERLVNALRAPSAGNA
jgi:monoamine oxidase